MTQATAAEELLLLLTEHAATGIEAGGWSAIGGLHDRLRKLKGQVERDIGRRPPANAGIGALNVEDVMAALDDLRAEVAAEKDLFQSGVATITGLANQLSAANAAGSNDPAIEALVQEMHANAAGLASAIVASTPAAASTGTAASSGTVSSAGTPASSGTAAAGGTAGSTGTVASTGTVTSGGTAASG